MQRSILFAALALAACAGNLPPPADPTETERDLRDARAELDRLRGDLAAARRAGSPAVASTPAPAVFVPPVMVGAMGEPVPAYPNQIAGYLARPPAGWGANALSIRVVNDASRWIEYGVMRGPYCHLGVEIDGQAVHFSRPATGGAAPVLTHVKEDGIVRTASVIPPGETGFILLDEPGFHSWRVRCYEGPERAVMLPTGPVPVRQLTAQATGRWYPGQRTLEITHHRLQPVVGN